jgi:hypothetical protein
MGPVLGGINPSPMESYTGPMYGSDQQTLQTSNADMQELKFGTDDICSDKGSYFIGFSSIFAESKFIPTNLSHLN